ncbi:MAG: hypothetical protein BWZ10_01978 [candidate division BRC1 bacterium ADurb.BinA364]|nr:MAG: hypothetical protein BWZ10_01978 [candidate division BRC1 bacterium ADurb.BinA364]
MLAAQKNRQPVFAVLGPLGMFFHRLAGQRGEGGEQIDQAEQLIARGSGRRLVAVADSALFPAGDERHAVAAFVDLRFFAAQRADRIPSAFFRSIVAGENEQRVVEKGVARIARVFRRFQDAHQLADGDVVFINEIDAPFGLRPRLGAAHGGLRLGAAASAVFQPALASHGNAVDFLGRRMGGVVGVGGVIQEKRLAARLAVGQMRFEKLLGVKEVFAAGAGVVVARHGFFAFARRGQDAAAFDPAGHRRAAMAARRQEAIIESVVERRIGERLAQIGVVPAFRRLAGGGSVLKSEVPLARHAGVVARFAQHRGDCRALLRNQRIGLRPPHHAMLERRPPGIAPRQKPIACRRADGRRRVRVGEAQAHAGQALHGRRVDLLIVRIPRPVLIGAGVADAHVIGHEEHDVRQGRLGRLGAARDSWGRGDQRAQPDGFHEIPPCVLLAVHRYSLSFPINLP